MGLFDKKWVRQGARISLFLLLFIIAYIAFLPNYEALPEFVSLSDVVNHFAAFFVLAFFLEAGYRKPLLFAFVSLFAYGLFIEAVQHFLPNRMFDLLDLVVDMSGVLFFHFLKRFTFLSRHLG